LMTLLRNLIELKIPRPRKSLFACRNPWQPTYWSSTYTGWDRYFWCCWLVSRAIEPERRRWLINCPTSECSARNTSTDSWVRC